MSRIHPVQHQTLTRNENRWRTTLLSPPGSGRILLLLPSFLLGGNVGRRCHRSLGGRRDRRASQMSRWLAAARRTAALAAEAWHQVHYGSEALVTGSRCPACGTQTLRNRYYTWQQMRRSICYFLVRWRVVGIYPCASCFGVAAYLILVFLSSLVGNLKPPNGIFHSPLPNCSDTLMR